MKKSIISLFSLSHRVSRIFASVVLVLELPLASPCSSFSGFRGAPQPSSDTDRRSRSRMEPYRTPTLGRPLSDVHRKRDDHGL